MNTFFFRGFEELAGRTAPLLARGSVALSVGTTYSRLFPLWLALEGGYRSTEFFPVDERMVPFEAPLSNWGTAYRLFLRHAGREVDKKNWPQSAEAYDALLKARFGTGIPVFDTVFLGVGSDGHTASLFPGQSYLSNDDSRVLETSSPIPPNDRVSLGPVVLASCRDLVIVLSGRGKEEIAQRVLDNDHSLPVVGIAGRHPAPLLFVDHELTQSTR